MKNNVWYYREYYSDHNTGKTDIFSIRMPNDRVLTIMDNENEEFLSFINMHLSYFEESARSTSYKEKETISAFLSSKDIIMHLFLTGVKKI